MERLTTQRTRSGGKEPAGVRSSSRWRMILVPLVVCLVTAAWLNEHVCSRDYLSVANRLAEQGDLLVLDDYPDSPLGWPWTDHLTVKGHMQIHQPFGRGVAGWPFVLLGRHLAGLFTVCFGPDGWLPLLDYHPSSLPDRYLAVWMNLSGFLSGILAVIILWKIAALEAGKGMGLLSVAAVVISTSFLPMMQRFQTGQPIVGMLLWSGIFWLCLCSYKSGNLTIAGAGFAGFLCGLAAFIHLTSIIWFIPPALVWLRYVLKEKPRLKSGALRGLVFIVFGFIAFLPQMFIWKIYYGEYLPDLYGHRLYYDTIPEILSILAQHPLYFTVSPLILLAIFGLAVNFRRRRGPVMMGLGVFIMMLGLSFFEKGSIEHHTIASGWHFMPVVPVYVLGISMLLGYFRGKPGRFYVSGAIIVLSLISLIRVFQTHGPGSAFVWLFRILTRIPVSPAGPPFALILFPFMVLLVAAWKHFRHYRDYIILGGSCMVGVLLIWSILLVCRRTEKAVDVRDAAGYYDARWRTATFNWGIFACGAKTRTAGYLSAGRFDSAQRLFNLAMAIAPHGGDIDYLPEIMYHYRREKGIGGHLWQGFSDRYGLPGRVSGVEGAIWSGKEFALDGDLETVARVEDFSRNDDYSLTIELDRGRGPVSDVLVVMDNPSALEKVGVTVSADGRYWESPFNVERWIDTLWVWDFHQRPWKYIKIEGFSCPGEASLRQVIVCFSPRHACPGSVIGMDCHSQKRLAINVD